MAPRVGLELWNGLEDSLDLGAPGLGVDPRSETNFELVSRKCDGRQLTASQGNALELGLSLDRIGAYPSLGSLSSSGVPLTLTPSTGE